MSRRNARFPRCSRPRRFGIRGRRSSRKICNERRRARRRRPLARCFLPFRPEFRLVSDERQHAKTQQMRGEHAKFVGVAEAKRGVGAQTNALFALKVRRLIVGGDSPDEANVERQRRFVLDEREQTLGVVVVILGYKQARRLRADVGRRSPGCEAT